MYADPDNTDPICPNCDTDDHLVELDPNEVAVLGKEDADEPDAVVEVPATKTYRYKCVECATESDVLNHGKCAFCGGEAEDLIENEAALKALEAASEADQSIPIPIPDQNRIPIATTKTHRKPGVFASLFRKRNKKS